jgi:CheY-like chemotaxis protein
MTREAQPLSGFSANVTLAGSRPNALARLRREGRHAAARRPALVLLDLTEGEQGWRLLSEIKEDPQLRRIPVIVLGPARRRDEKARAYRLRANSYLVCPEGPASLGDLIQKIEEFWLTKVKLPTG